VPVRLPHAGQNRAVSGMGVPQVEQGVSGIAGNVGEKPELGTGATADLPFPLPQLPGAGNFSVMPTANSVTLRFLAEPTHVNFGGKVHGGAVMKWIDQAGYTCAAMWTGDYCVTAYVGGIRFLQPISVGELVEVRAQVIHTGRTSLQIAIDIYSGDPRSSTHRRSAHCVMVFVAIGADGVPTPVPKWTPATPVEQALEAYALRLTDVRKQLDQEIEDRLRWLDQQPEAVMERGA